MLYLGFYGVIGQLSFDSDNEPYLSWSLTDYHYGVIVRVYDTSICLDGHWWILNRHDVLTVGQ